MRIHAFRCILAIVVLTLLAAPAWSAADLDVRIASYLGNGPEAETQEAVAVAPDGSVLIGGTTTAAPAGTPTDLGGTTGTITRLSADGRVLSVSRLGGFVDDLDMDPRDGAIAVATDAGLAQLGPDAQEVRWHADLGPGGGADGSTGRRVAVGGDGTVAALYGKTVSVFDATGESLGNFAVDHQFVEDVAVDAESGTVIVTGFDNKRLPGGQPVQVAFLSGHEFGGAQKWANYGHDGELLEGNEADTRGYRVSIGRDGKLYLAGESAGGDSIFRFQPRDLGVGALVKGDDFQHAFNSGSEDIAYVGRFDPAGGRLEAGTLILTRLDSNGKGNTMRPRAIAADEDGNIYLAGSSACCIPGSATQTFSGQKAPGDSSGGAFVTVLTPDLRQRLLWATWGASGQVRGVDAGQGLAALAGRVTDPGSMVTVAPLPGQEGSSDNASRDAADGYVSIWSGFAEGAPVLLAPQADGAGAGGTGSDADDAAEAPGGAEAATGAGGAEAATGAGGASRNDQEAADSAPEAAGEPTLPETADGADGADGAAASDTADASQSGTGPEIQDADLARTGSGLSGIVALVAAVTALSGGGLLLRDSRQRRAHRPATRAAREPTPRADRQRTPSPDDAWLPVARGTAAVPSQTSPRASRRSPSR